MFNRHTNKFKRFMHDENDDSSIGHNDVSVIYEDQQQVLWVGTLGGGLCKFYDGDQNFKSYRSGPEDETINSNFITSISEDSNGGLWVGTLYGGANHFDRFTETFKHYMHDDDDPTSLTNNNVRDLLCDDKGRLWIGTDYGLNLYNPIEKEFKHFNLNIGGLSSDFVKDVFQDSKGQIWVGTQNGFNMFFEDTQRFSAYFNDENDIFSISNNNVLTIAEDHTGNIWIGTDEGGLNMLDYYSRKFANYRHQANNKQSLVGGNVRAFLEDNEGNIWAATRGGGLNKYDKNLKYVKAYQPDVNNPFSLNNSKIMALEMDTAGIIWVGTEGGGINRFDPATGKFSHSGNDIKYAALSSTDVLSLYLDEAGILWIGTLRGGLNRFDPATGVFRTYVYDRTDNNSISDNNVSTIFKAKNGEFWVGTFDGLNLFDTETEKFKRYVGTPTSTNRLSDNYVKSLYEDTDGMLWIGTTGGLNQFDRESGEFKAYLIDDGLPNEVIYGILEDQSKQLWISTNKGLSCWNRKEETFRNYSTHDGLQGNEFNTGASLEDQQGRMFFGGLNGFNVFYPDSIQTNGFIPPVVLSGFTIFNKPVEIGKGILKYDISETDEIVLDHDQTVFSIEFAALNFTSAQKNQYKYKLKGFQEEWSNIGSRRFVTFTNLDPGAYEFCVLGSNNDGVWNNKGRSLRIIVRPAYWQTQWFTAIIVGVVLFALFLFIMVREANIKIQKKKLEEQVNERTAEIVKEKEAKEVLLKEIHHRVKNNLQVITSLLRLQSHHVEDEKMLELFAESQNRVVSMALIHEKIYESKDLAHVDLREYVMQLTENLISTYNLKKDIGLDIDVRVTTLSLDVLTPVGLILNELISNALKYGFGPEESGTITVHLDKVTKDKFRLIVGDNGVGLPEEVWNDQESQSFGLELVRTLSDQLDGTLTRLPREGTFFELVFKEKTSPSLN